MRTVPRGRRLEAADDLDQRALAAAARAEQAGEAAGAEAMARSDRARRRSARLPPPQTCVTSSTTTSMPIHRQASSCTI